MQSTRQKHKLFAISHGSLKPKEKLDSCRKEILCFNSFWLTQKKGHYLSGSRHLISSFHPQSLFLQDQHQAHPPQPLKDQDTPSHLSTDVFIRCWADKGKADQENVL